jgi:hypothetical protein
MFLQNLRLQNLGPIESLDLQFRKLDDKPVPVVLVGENGTGKSLVLGVVLDAMTEARRHAFVELPEVPASKYIRLSLLDYVKTGAKSSLAEVTFRNEDQEQKFCEIVRTQSFADFRADNSALVAELGLEQHQQFQETGFFKAFRLQGAAKQSIVHFNFLYFPSFRYERPAWLSGKSKIEFENTARMHGEAPVNPVRTDLIAGVKNWMLDILLDRELYEKVLSTTNIGGQQMQIFHGYEGPNSRVFEVLRGVLEIILKAKDSSIKSARFAIARKDNRDIQVLVQRGNVEHVYAPDIGQLSSGELMVFCMASEIIRAFERNKMVNQLEDVDGLVLIDEVDLHLHLELQKEALPRVIRILPNVQFVLTTHSPLFLLGMSETGPVDIYELPTGAQIAPEQFVEFQKSYSVYVAENERFHDRYVQLQGQLTAGTLPLVITEGKTDWQHLKAALAFLKAKGEYESLELQFLEFDDSVDMGDERLKQMCDATSRLPAMRKMIFVFDRDNEKIIRLVAGTPGKYRQWNTKVFSLCLPVPSHREAYENISIEMLYTDEVLVSVDSASGKRLWFSNEIKKEILPGNKLIWSPLGEAVASEEYRKKVFDEVSLLQDAEGRLLGLSKAAFVETHILNPTISETINRDAFRAVFDVIKEIVEMT